MFVLTYDSIVQTACMGGGRPPWVMTCPTTTRPGAFLRSGDKGLEPVGDDDHAYEALAFDWEYEPLLTNYADTMPMHRASTGSLMLDRVRDLIGQILHRVSVIHDAPDSPHAGRTTDDSLPRVGVMTTFSNDESWSFRVAEEGKSADATYKYPLTLYGQVTCLWARLRDLVRKVLALTPPSIPITELAQLGAIELHPVLWPKDTLNSLQSVLAELQRIAPVWNRKRMDRQAPESSEGSLLSSFGRLAHFPPDLTSTDPEATIRSWLTSVGRLIRATFGPWQPTIEPDYYKLRFGIKDYFTEQDLRLLNAVGMVFVDGVVRERHFPCALAVFAQPRPAIPASCTRLEHMRPQWQIAVTIGEHTSFISTIELLYMLRRGLHRLDLLGASHAPLPTAPLPREMRLILRRLTEPPIIGGVEKSLLTPAQFNVLTALVNAGESGLTKDELVTKSDHEDAVGILKRLHKRDADWAAVTPLPGRTGGRYRVLVGPPIPDA